MRPRIVILFGMLACAAGCSTTMFMDYPPPSPDRVVDYVNRTGAEKSGFVRTRGASLLSPRLAIADSVLLVMGLDEHPGTIPLADVESIRFRDRTRGAWEGAVAGMGLAAALGLSTLFEEHNRDLFGSPSETVLVVSAIAGFATVPIGALLGALIGHRTTVEVTPPPMQ